MAAPPVNPSPSNEEVQQNVEGGEPVKETVKTSVAEETESKTTASLEEAGEKPTMHVPTYESSETSEYFILAKQFLNDGDFEQALETIEGGIEEAKTILLSLNVESDLHECMAPFHYLYGTTLLYSIEESNDTQMTVANAGGESPPGEEQQNAQANAGPAEVNVDDMEIAWENLEAARNILDIVLRQDMSKERKLKLQSDQAQVLLRVGDLQRMNGRYAEAIHDYEACLKLRQQLLPRFDRKIADAQYNLGLSYLSSSTEIQTQDSIDEAGKKLSQEHCFRGLQLYLECAKTICGQIAMLCGSDSEVILNKRPEKSVGLKTTGMEQDLVTHLETSSSLKTLRYNVSGLTPEKAGDNSVVVDLRQLLDEIQETVDEVQNSQEAVRQAVSMKVQAKMAVSGEEIVEASGSTTKIGFDKPTLAENQLKADNQSDAKPVMVVKKKKKKQPPTDEEPDAKRAKAE